MPQSVEDKIKHIQELAKKDKSINVAALVEDALKTQEANLLPAKLKRWGYFVSLGFPPFGLLFALMFWFREEEDAQSTAVVCVVLTSVSILAFVLIVRIVLSGSGVSTQDIQNIDIDQYRQLLE